MSDETEMKPEDWDSIVKELAKSQGVKPKPLTERPIIGFRDICLVQQFFAHNPKAKFSMISCPCRGCNPYTL